MSLAPASVQPTTSLPRRKRFGGLRQSEWLWGYAFISLNLLGFTVFSLGPIIASFGMAFTEWPLLRPPRFVGLANFARLLDDQLFRTVFFNTVYYVAGFVPLVTVFAFLLAVMLNRQVKGIQLLRTAYFLPSITLLVAVAMVWQWMLDPQAGIINYIFKWFGLSSPQWLANRRLAMPTLIIVAVWQEVGYYAVIYLAGLQSIPSSLYEAAEIDGANAWQRLIHITVPLISPTTFFVLVTSLISAWQVFGLPYLMTGGGPAHGTRTLLQYTYEQAYGSLRMGYAALMAWVLFIMIFSVTILQWRVSKGGEHVLAQ